MRRAVCDDHPRVSSLSSSKQSFAAIEIPRPLIRPRSHPRNFFGCILEVQADHLHDAGIVHMRANRVAALVNPIRTGGRGLPSTRTPNVGYRWVGATSMGRYAVDQEAVWPFACSKGGSRLVRKSPVCPSFLLITCATPSHLLRPRASHLRNMHQAPSIHHRG